MANNITRLSNGKVVDLSDLSIDSLYKLHFDEEAYVASEIMKHPPFSTERTRMMIEGYDLIRKIKVVRATKENFQIKSYGATFQSRNLVTRLVREKLKNDPSVPFVFFEVGVGTGYIIEELSKMFKIEVQGCDLLLTGSVKELLNSYPNLHIEQGNVIDVIKKMPDNSIDFFYADNVFEHFIPDEIEAIYAEIEKKLKPGAYVLLIIPNRHIGPHDISRKYLPMGAPAVGFHFMEMSFSEITSRMKANGIEQLYSVYSIPKIRVFYVKIFSKAQIKIKLILEPIIAKIPIKIVRKIIFHVGAYHVSILKKSI